MNQSKKTVVSHGSPEKLVVQQLFKDALIIFTEPDGLSYALSGLTNKEAVQLGYLLSQCLKSYHSLNHTQPYLYSLKDLENWGVRLSAILLSLNSKPEAPSTSMS